MRVLTLSPAQQPGDVCWTLEDTMSGTETSGSAPASKLPLDESSLDVVRAQHVLDSLPDLHAAMAELHRVLLPQGLIYAAVPHASSSFSAWRDPHSRREFTSQTFRWFERHPPPFKVDKVRLNFVRDDPAVPPGMARRILARPLERLANRHEGAVHRAERYWGNILGFEEMEVVLRVIKPDPDPL
jgi:SAM-dependent methyltransferase